VVVGIVESLGSLTRTNDLTLLDLPHPPPTGPLCGLRPLEPGELVEDTVSQHPLRAVVAVVVEGLQARTVLKEFLAEDVVMGRLAGEPIPILGEDHVDATARDGVTQGIEHESIQRSPGCPILELPHYLKGVIVTVTS
jgi:hypothetical protein